MIMDEELLALKWNNHKKIFLNKISSFWNNSSYSDVTLACDGEYFQVHKLILSSCSDYFEEIFEKTQCKSPVVILKDIKSSELRSLLQYMYLGEVTVHKINLANLIKAAECLKIKGLASSDESETKSDEKKNKRKLDQSQIKECRKKIFASESSRYDHTDALNLESSLLDQSNEEYGQKTHNDASNLEYSLLNSSNEEYGQKTHTDANLESSLLDPSNEEYGQKTHTGASNLEYSLLNSSNEEYGQKTHTNASNLEYSLLNASNEEYGKTTLGVAVDDFVSVKLEPEEFEEVEISKSEALPDKIDYDNYQLENEPTDCANTPSTSDIKVEDIDAPSQAMNDKYSKEVRDLINNEIISLDPMGTICSVCSQAFVNRMDLRNHFDVHLPFKCKVCMRGFSSKEHIQTHMRIHIVQKPYSCKICNRTFTQKGNLRRHIKAHSGAKPFQCNYCNYKSARKLDLQRHAQSRHRDIICEYETN